MSIHNCCLDVCWLLVFFCLYLHSHIGLGHSEECFSALWVSLMFQNKNLAPPKPRPQTSPGCIYLQILRNIYFVCTLAPTFLLNNLNNMVSLCCTVFTQACSQSQVRPWSHNDLAKLVRIQSNPDNDELYQGCKLFIRGHLSAKFAIFTLNR